jgi:hypothetical protein
MNAATPPGTPILRIVGQSTLPNLMWERPEKAVVTTSAKCTIADAAAGLYARSSKMLVAETPNPIPIEPSMSWARNPARETSKRIHIDPLYIFTTV